MTGIEQAVAAAGSQEALARMVGVQQSAVGKWKRRGYVSRDKITAVSAATGVPARALLNPVYREIVGVG